MLIIDSLSHARNDKGGILKLHDAITAQEHNTNDFTAWRQVTPEHNKLVDAIFQSPMRVIATMRVKTEYVTEKNEEGKTVIRKVGLKPIQRG